MDVTGSPATAGPPIPWELRTERLRLRRFEPGDAPFILRLLNEPGFLRFIGDRGVRTLEDARLYLERVPLESYRTHGFGVYLVERGPRGIPIGMCGLTHKEWLPAPDLAYAFLAEHGGHGFATEAARAVLAHARATLRLERLVAIVLPDNTASIRLLQKLGFTAEGVVVDPRDGAELLLYGSRTGVSAPATGGG